MEQNKLSLHYMQNNPFDAILIKDTKSNLINTNNSFKKIFKLKNEKTLSELLPKICNNKKDQNAIREYIKKAKFNDSLTFDIFNNKKHYKFQFYYDPNDELVIMHVRNMNELDSLNSQLKEYTQELVQNIIKLELSQRELKEKNLVLKTELIARQKAEKSLNESLEIQEKLFNQMIESLSLIEVIKDPYTGMHQKRVAKLAKSIAERMNLNPFMIQSIYIAGMLHDIGKLSIPTEILSKPGKINDNEYTLIRNHPKISFDIIKDIDFPWPIANIIYQHHEKLDGSGYPEGLTKDEILLEAKILSVADVIEAMISHRPYRESLGIDNAINEIIANKGKLYDEKTVDVCIEILNDNFTFE